MKDIRIKARLTYTVNIDDVFEVDDNATDEDIKTLLVEEAQLSNDWPKVEILQQTFIIR